MVPTLEQLMAATPEVQAAPKDRAEITMLCLRPGYNERRFVDAVDVTPEQGIPGERWGTRPWLTRQDGSGHPGIQICILSKRVLDLVWRERENTPHPGDTFVVDMDLSEGNLPPGQLLQAGSAVLKVSDIFNDGCVKWQARYGADARAWVNRPEFRTARLRGILCSVEQGGRIANGDVLIKI